MKRFSSGLGLGLFGVLAVVGGLAQGNNSDGVLGGLFLMAVGGVLALFGWRSMSARKATAELALQQIRASGVIDAADLARRLGLSEVDVRGHLLSAQQKGLVPIHAEVV